MIQEKKEPQLLYVEKLGKIFLKNRVFFYENIFLFPFVQWNLWVYFESQGSVKILETNNAKKAGSNYLKAARLAVEFLLGLVRQLSRRLCVVSPIK